eukprot:c7734_g1_i2.p1 GENE.c7734_g1_i2~~c7734_g1_i2.p1  ORF type:complete len:322 (-),score=57.37 c7734_g1_i2:28-993(-)
MTTIDFQAMLKAERKKTLAKSSNSTQKKSPSQQSVDLDALELHPSFNIRVGLAPRVQIDSSKFQLDCAGFSGISYIPNFVTGEEGAELVKAVLAMPTNAWVQLSHRRLQTFGGTPHSDGMYPQKLPAWVDDVIQGLCEAGIFGEDDKEDLPKPNHILMNEYQPGQGIMPHKDGPLYFPKVAILSLASTATLEFWNTLEDARFRTSPPVASVFCEQNSLTVFDGHPYHNMFHGIHDTISDDISQVSNAALLSEETRATGPVVPRTAARLSFTIRRVLKVRTGEPLASSSAQEEEARKARQFTLSISEGANKARFQFGDPMMQ